MTQDYRTYQEALAAKFRYNLKDVTIWLITNYDGYVDARCTIRGRNYTYRFWHDGTITRVY